MRRTVVTAVFAALALSGCTWAHMEGDPARAIQADTPDRVRVTTLDGREYVVRNPNPDGSPQTVSPQDC